MIRIAAVGDLHIGEEARGRFRPAFAELAGTADLLLIAGDLTRRGTREEALAVRDELTGLPIPTIAVLGNHDHESGCQDEVASILRDAGIVVLEGSSTVHEVDGVRVGIAGTKGFGGGFAGSSGTEFGEEEMKAFIRHSRALAERLGWSLAGLDTDVRIALMHYAPVRETLRGEPPEIYPFLGSFLLAEAVDNAGADLALHGHAHAGVEKGVTPGGVHVRNVAHPVIRHAYNLYTIEPKAHQAPPQPDAISIT